MNDNLISQNDSFLKSEIQHNKIIIDLMKIEEFNLDKPYFHTRKTEDIVFLDTEESAEELVQLLTK